MKNYLVLFLLLPLLCWSQVPPYYGAIDFSKTGSELQEELSLLVALTHTTELPYTSGATDTWDAVKQTDLVPGDTENVLLFYGYDDMDGMTETDYTRDKDLSCHTTSCSGLWNREHVYARSRATPSLTTDDPGSGTDVHNLRACDGDRNVTRLNRLFDYGSGNSQITGSGNWYPGDEWKGDVARIIMYMHIRYTSQCPANDIGAGPNTYHADMPDVFLDWNAEDPVSAYETQRNTILESMQGNRNPFIDNPYIATLLWGGTPAADAWGLLSTEVNELDGISVYPTLVTDRLFVSNNSTKDLDLVIYSLDGRSVAVHMDDDQIAVGNLSKGIYILSITGDAGTRQVKFIKN